MTSLSPVFDDGRVTLYHGDCRDILPLLDPVDVVVTDPPYGDTSLDWDQPVAGWLDLVAAPQMWCFGSMRFWLKHGHDFDAWTYGQEVVWEKHNGSSFHADRFKRVHEFAVHWYRGSWANIRHEPPLTFDATPRIVRRKRRPPHTGHIEASSYTSEDGGPRLMRSVVASAKPNNRPLNTTGGHPAPTVAFAVDLEIPDAMFKQAEQVIATLSIPESRATIVAEVAQQDAEGRRAA